MNPIARTAGALRRGDTTATALIEVAIARHEELDERLHAYRYFDPTDALRQARAADEAIAAASSAGTVPPPLTGIPVSVKDIVGVTGMPTYAGSARRLPVNPWSHDAWLVERLRAAGAIIMGKTQTVEFAYGGVGFNPHWGTPLNPWDADTPRIPGGSSCGAGVSLWEGSADVAIGSDTGGSIRIPAGFTGVVGHKTTKGRWPTDGVVQLSTTFDTVGALTRSVADSLYFFGSVDPRWGDPALLLEALETTSVDGMKIGLPECTVWEACATDIRDTLESALEELESAGARIHRIVGTILDDAEEHYMSAGIGKAELNAFLSDELPEWIEILHPTVGGRITDPRSLTSDAYRTAVAKQRRMAALAGTLFAEADIIVLPTNIITPPPVADVADDLDRYVEVNLATLRATCPVNLLELCAISIPVGLDAAGMPVGLQLIGRNGDDEGLLGVALAIERVLGTGADRMGSPPALG
jgi:aspartyl-tRNA(Asn)/glutamyl-tRNA(Gln) amidotransferase subunit A